MFFVGQRYYGEVTVCSSSVILPSDLKCILGLELESTHLQSKAEGGVSQLETLDPDGCEHRRVTSLDKKEAH